MEYLRKEKKVQDNDKETILISYDFQAGSYIKFVEENPDFIQYYTQAIALVFEGLGINFETVLEVGVGEATVLGNLAKKISKKCHLYGFDLSWSRVKFAQKYCDQLGVQNVDLFTGDLFSAPLQDNSIDIYTSHSIEPNGGREKEALQELYRITRKYLILLEPCYELATEKARERMKAHGYITNLQQSIREMGYKVLEFRLFDYYSNPLNPTGLTIIEKKSEEVIKENPYACPITKSEMKEYSEGFYCETSLLAYPKLLGVPLLCPENSILACHFNAFKK
ncbi:MAG: class I SAM-dependent methyltransferase [Candidatus Bathyarchaeia archaeon]